jgi:hypothetical protein
VLRIRKTVFRRWDLGFDITLGVKLSHFFFPDFKILSFYLIIAKVGVKKPTQKNPPKKPTQKTHLKKTTKNVFLGFFWVFLNFYENNTNFSLSNGFFMNK